MLSKNLKKKRTRYKMTHVFLSLIILKPFNFIKRVTFSLPQFITLPLLPAIDIY